ncbi:MAG: cation transporter, partial [Polyangiaceae bacterium]|nr:cation transporter [Polyangiaceae bacterium]
MTPTDQPQTSRFRVSGLDCSSCAAVVVAATKKIPNVVAASVSITSSTLTIEHRRDLDILPLLQAQLHPLGHSVFPTSDATQLPDSASQSTPIGQSQEQRPNTVRSEAKNWIIIAICAALLVLGHTPLLSPTTQRITLIAAAITGLVPIIRRAVWSVRLRIPWSIEMLVSLSVTGAIAINATGEAAAVVLLFLVGKQLETIAAQKARSGISNLTALVPKHAVVEQDGQTMEVDADSLQPDATVLVRPGDRIAADGLVL